jgi:hypothetical protein
MWLREEAERYFRLAYSLTAQKDYDTVMDYGRELLHRAELIETALSSPSAGRAA